MMPPRPKCVVNDRLVDFAISIGPEPDLTVGSLDRVAHSCLCRVADRLIRKD